MKVPTPKRRTQAERREVAESRLLRAAVDLLSERGYDGFSVAEVGERAGYSRGIVAHYFSSKDELLSLTAKYVVENYAVSLAHLPATEPGLPRLAAIIRNHARVANNKASRALGVLLTEATLRPSLKKTIAELNRRGHTTLRAELAAGVAAGNISSKIDLDVSARVIFTFIRCQMSFALLDRTYDQEMVADDFIATLSQGLCATRR